MSKKNHIEDFRYKMQQECKKHGSYCEYCRYYYAIYDSDRCNHRMCFLQDLVNYISYQAERHG